VYVGWRTSQSPTNGVDANGRRRQVDSHLPSKTVPGRLDTGRVRVTVVQFGVDNGGIDSTGYFRVKVRPDAEGLTDMRITESGKARKRLSKIQESLANARDSSACTKAHSEEIYNQRSEHNVEKYIQWATTLSLCLYSFSCFCEIPQNSPKIRTYSSSRLSKVINLGGNRKCILHMQLPISH